MARKKTSIQLDEEQVDWLEKNHINVSSLFRNLLYQEMKKRGGFK